MVGGEAVPGKARNDLLKLNFSSSKNKNALPGFIPLYVGMPVILKGTNISVDLKLTNGSQGIVHKIYTEIDDTGLTHAVCALVHFPMSTVKLSNLPQGVFPITPQKWTFTTCTTSEDGSLTNLRVTRHQLPIQPAFAVTGHAAQGKTLPSVEVNL
ncbi:hypothetical protein BOTBODRAFT_122384, partial [Botryobasidium botryosum FD-172 SS1]